MGQKLTNVEPYIVWLFLFGVVVTGLLYLGDELLSNSNADLDNDSIDYIANLQGINVSDYSASKSQIEQPILISGNASQGNPKDYALEYLYAKEKGYGVEIIIKGIFSLPEFILVDLFRFKLNDWNWVIEIFNWLYRIFILIALVYFARGIVTR